MYLIGIDHRKVSWENEALLVDTLEEKIFFDQFITEK